MQFQTTRSFILASASPRRKELFGRLNIPFEIVTADVEETSVQASEVSQYVTEVALLKARAVAKLSPGQVVIGADTIVAKDNQLLHKPKSHFEAMAHLRTLRNTAHEVLTAVAIIEEDGTETTVIEKTTVIFKKVSDALLEAYVATGDPFDKAGGYGIQTEGVFLVDRIEGDYLNVVGLPLASLCEHLIARKLITL
ncbi:Maf family protein [Viridibacillus sp. FSL R5-0477]|uniref:dTTP/UTP pyrophosphatase n=1 Tax=Viridibacillus arenosi FSL R5-213 TaxID=1227360 RepID=W4F134_9BACL|nr:Maf family protein [Viridibacillus arenosi]ETT86179.1 septum formation protein Maf [Viridibacillus arenosi FSL R5-213]OMC91964.1 septum formation protein Maf [Viridibacillus arenosi]